MNKDLIFISGSSNVPLAQEMSKLLGFTGRIKPVSGIFPDKEILVKLPYEVSDKVVFVLQSTAFFQNINIRDFFSGIIDLYEEVKMFEDEDMCIDRLIKNTDLMKIFSPNDSFMELLQICEAAKTSGAEKVIPVIPYFAYARQDRKDESLVPITSSLVAYILVKLGISSVLLFDLHNAAIQGFFRGIRADHLYARPVLINFLKGFFDNDLSDVIILGGDYGIIKVVEKYLERMEIDEIPLGFPKKRESGDKVVKRYPRGFLEMLSGIVKGKKVVILDDIFATGGTMLEAAQDTMRCGALEVYPCIIHGIFAGSAFEKIARAKKDGIIKNIIVTDTLDYGKRMPKDFPDDIIIPVSISKLLAEAILRIYRHKPLGELFDENYRYSFVKE